MLRCSTVGEGKSKKFATLGVTDITNDGWKVENRCIYRDEEVDEGLCSGDIDQNELKRAAAENARRSPLSASLIQSKTQ